MPPAIPVAESPAGPVLDRAVAVSFVAAGGGMTWLLRSVQPDARGHGTHEQLGMQPCGWPATMGVPCPTCGVTTAATHLVHLQPLRAVATQPFGAALAAAGLVLAVMAAVALVRGHSFVERLARLPYGTLLLGAMILFAASWLYTYLTFTP